MPHKRSKKSARDADRAAQGTDNAPTSKNEGVLAGQNAKFGGLSAKMYRILNAESIRKEKRERDAALKRKREDGTDENSTSTGEATTAAGTGASSSAKKLKIMPGEKLKSFNARVEETMRADVSSAIKQSKSARKKNKLSRAAQLKADLEAEEAALHKPPPRRDEVSGATKERASDFSARESVKLNDVAMEPPSLKFGTKSMSKITAKDKKAIPVSMKQKLGLDQERERAIQHYRDIKARQAAERDQ